MSQEEGTGVDGSCTNMESPPSSLMEWFQLLVAASSSTTTERNVLVGGLTMAVVGFLYLLCDWWKRHYVGYHLQVWWEYFTQSIPLISVEMTELEVQDACSLPRQDQTNIHQAPHDNKKSSSSNKKLIHCYDPSTRQYLGPVPAMTAAEIHEACVRAKQAQEEWARTTTFADRRKVLRTIQKYIVHHMEDICRVSSRDSGKSVVDALLGEVMTTCEKIRCLLAWGEIWLLPSYRPSGPMMMHKTAWVEYVPYGIVAPIAPWNYPFHNFFNHIVSGILAGNAVVGKVSEHTSWSSQYYTRIIQQALRVHGHDPNLVQTITGFGDTGAALVQESLVNKIIFTGSPDIGRKVMEGASAHLKPVILELGGKDPMILQETCRIKDVVPWILRGCYQNCGQNCVGVERVFVYESIAEELINAVVPRVQAMRPGIPLNVQPDAAAACPSTTTGADVDCGSLVMEEQIQLIQTLIDDAVQKGAKVLVGGKPIRMDQTDGGGSIATSGSNSGHFYPPTIITNVTPDMDIFHREVFGPVMTIVVVPNNDDNKCAELVNQSCFGLGASIFCGKSYQQSRAIPLGRQIQSGMVYVNDFGCNYLVQSLPFGGVKDSGFGRFGGPEGLRALCVERSWLIDTVPYVAQTGIPPPLDYPIHPTKAPGFAKGIMHLFYNDSILAKIKGIVDLIRYGS